MLVSLTVCTYSQHRSVATKNSEIRSASAKKPLVRPIAAAKCIEKTGLSTDGISEILDAQNQARGQFNLPKLTWNCDLANMAQAWATRGIFEHSDTTFGENIFASTDLAVTPTTVVQKWLTESAFWNNTSATCQTGKICTHFTQIVWRSTKQVGCGINRNTPGKWKVLLVCNYDPTGGSYGPAY